MGAILSGILSLIKGPEPCRIVMGFNIETVEHGNISFTVWDIPFHSKMRPVWRHYFPGTSAAIFIVDSTDKERFPEARESLQYLLDDPQLDYCPLLVMANKQDLPEAVSPASITEVLELERLKRPWFIQGTSALNSTGIYESLDWLAKEVKK